jgi:CarboxypepD_reg-like domain
MKTILEMKTIILTNTLILLFIVPNISWAQVVTITGYINDSLNGAAIENVSVFESNTEIGTISNPNGFYKLRLRGKDLNLQITSDGYQDYNRKLELTSDTTIFVKLIPLTDDKHNVKDEEVQAGIKPAEKKAVQRKGLKLF